MAKKSHIDPDKYSQAVVDRERKLHPEKTPPPPPVGITLRELAGAIEYQVDKAVSAHQQVTLSMSLRDALTLAKTIRRAELLGG